MIVILVDILIVALLLVADLVSKYYAASRLGDGSTYEAIKNVLSFRYSKNTGAAFGIFHDAKIFLIVFVLIVILVLISYMVYHIVKGKYKEKGGMFLHVSLSLIVAGGIGNLVDRIAFGYVRDFIDYTVVYTLFKRHFAICNLADAFLTIGVIMIAIYLIWLLIQEGKKERKEKAAALPDKEPEAFVETPSLPTERESIPEETDTLLNAKEEEKSDDD